MGFPERLRMARRELGLTQEELARQLGSISETQISLYERGRQSPSMDNLVKIADELGLSTDWLLERPSFETALAPKVQALISIVREMENSDDIDVVLGLATSLIARQDG